MTLYEKNADTCSNFAPKGIELVFGGWRFINSYNDTVGARALHRNAVDLNPPLQRGNLTVEACLSACGAAGFILAGTEYADECYCGNEFDYNSQPIPCDQKQSPMPCKGNPYERCGGPNLLDVYALSAAGLSPLIPYDY